MGVILSKMGGSFTLFRGVSFSATRDRLIHARSSAKLPMMAKSTNQSSQSLLSYYT